jgi:hypothetical protein
MKINLISFCFCIAVGGVLNAQKKVYPKFSWEKVPVTFHFRKVDTLLTKQEAEFIAAKTSLITFEKAHALGKGGKLNTEESIIHDARVLKRINPEIKVFFYWNALLDYPFYKASYEFNSKPNWWLKKEDGTLDIKSNSLKKYDLTDVKLREWWVNVVKKNIDNDFIDGVFIDALNQVKADFNIKSLGEEKFNEMNSAVDQLMKETREKIGVNKMILWNGIRSTPHKTVGNDYLNETDAVMIEHFGAFHSATPETMASDLDKMHEAGKAKKIVIFKGWPGFTWLDKEDMALPLETKRQIAKSNIEFPLAAFLIAAQEHAYFVYNWGYRMDFGGLEWYPEYDKPLGKPLGDFTKKGFIYTREFEHASVYLDLKETQKSKISWY